MKKDGKTLSGFVKDKANAAIDMLSRKRSGKTPEERLVERVLEEVFKPPIVEEIIDGKKRSVYKFPEGRKAYINLNSEALEVNADVIEFPEGFETLGEGTLMSSRVMRVKFPSTIKDVHNFAFSHCDNLREVEFAGVTFNLEYNRQTEMRDDFFIVNGAAVLVSCKSNEVMMMDAKSRRCYFYKLERDEFDYNIHYEYNRQFNAIKKDFFSRVENDNAKEQAREDYVSYLKATGKVDRDKFKKYVSCLSKEDAELMLEAQIEAKARQDALREQSGLSAEERKNALRDSKNCSLRIGVLERHIGKMNKAQASDEIPKQRPLTSEELTKNKCCELFAQGIRAVMFETKYNKALAKGEIDHNTFTMQLVHNISEEDAQKMLGDIEQMLETTDKTSDKFAILCEEQSMLKERIELVKSAKARKNTSAVFVLESVPFMEEEGYTVFHGRTEVFRCMYYPKVENFSEDKKPCVFGIVATRGRGGDYDIKYGDLQRQKVYLQGSRKTMQEGFAEIGPIGVMKLKELPKEGRQKFIPNTGSFQGPAYEGLGKDRKGKMYPSGRMKGINKARTRKPYNPTSFVFKEVSDIEAKVSASETLRIIEDKDYYKQYVGNKQRTTTELPKPPVVTLLGVCPVEQCPRVAGMKNFAKRKTGASGTQRV